MSRHRTDLREVEQSPDGRYVRFDEKLGNGAFKEVYLSYDTETGKEVAWNTVEMRRLPANEKRRIRSETEILAELQHPHIINFYHVWENKEKDQICFTTEIVTSGTLKQYTNRVKSIKLKVIKKWCRQILTALDYLHSHDPPIIHRDLKCDNIFINGSTGEIRLGDFGLSAHRACTHVASVLGTPEFMAPELYDEHYNESVDVYSFGMCCLEMISKEYPYEECTNAAQIWKKVSSGQKPDVLARVQDDQVRSFIELCIAKESDRLSASELLAHPFLSFRQSDSCVRDNCIVTMKPRSRPTSRPGSNPVSMQQAEAEAKLLRCGDKHTVQQELAAERQTLDGPMGSPAQSPQSSPPAPRQSPVGLQSLFHPPAAGAQSQQQQQRPHTSNVSGKESAYTVPVNAYGDGPPATAPSPAPSANAATNPSPAPAPGSSTVPSVVSTILVEIESASGATANIVLHIHLDHGRRKKLIRFALDFRHDTSMSLAGEMVQSLKLPDSERTQMMIASAMENKIDPVRKAYFAHMASESSSPLAQGDLADEAGKHPVFQHTSYTQQPVAHMSQGVVSGRPVAAASAVTRTISTPVPGPTAGAGAGVGVGPALAKPPTGAGIPPSVSPLPPHPSNVPVRLNTAPPGGISVGGGVSGAPPVTRSLSKEPPPQTSPPSQGDVQRSQTPGMPRQSPIPPAGSRPATAGPGMSSRGVGTMPASMAAALTAAAAAVASQSGAPGHSSTIGSGTLPAGSSAAGAHKHSASLPQNSLPSLASFNSSEEYEAYLQGEFKALSVSALKERIKSKPGGADLVKACFEKPDLIQVLVRITLQEQAGQSMQQQQSQQSQQAQAQMQQSRPQMQAQTSAPKPSPIPHKSFTSSPIEQPDFLSPTPEPLPPHAHPGAGSLPQSPIFPHSGQARNSTPHLPHLSPDPFIGLDALMADSAASSPFSASHSSADHRFNPPPQQQQQHQQSQQQQSQSQQSASGPPMRKATSLLDMESEAHAAQRQQQHQHLSHHHTHHSIDSTPTALSSFPFHNTPTYSDANSLTPHSGLMSDPSDHDNERSPSPAPHGDPLLSGAGLRSHDGSLGVVVGGDDEVADSNGPAPFDFQVSVSSPASSPDVGLDAGLDGSPNGGSAQPDLDEFLSPAAGPSAHHHKHHTHVHSANSPPMGSEPASAPNSSARSSAFPYDLLSRPSTAGGGGGSVPAASKPHHRHSSSMDRSRERTRGGPSLGGVMEDVEGALDDHSGMLPPDSSASLSDLLGGGEPSRPSGVQPSPAKRRHTTGPVSASAAATLDPELSAFFDKPRRTDLLDPSNAHHLIPGNAAIQSHHEKQQRAHSLASGSATLPAGGINLANMDMWAHDGVKAAPSQQQQQSQQQQRVGNGVSATGTKATRSHTTTDVDTCSLDFFASAAAASPSPAHTPLVSPPATKQQRTKSEADQAEAAILHFNL